MAQRRRKRRPSAHGASATATPVATPVATPPPASSTGSGSAGVTPPPSRSEARNEAVRATLAPLEPGERPWALKISALIALLIGAGDLITVLVKGAFDVGGAHAGASGVILFSALMLLCAWGMWQQRYWAVLGFQAILVFVILFFSVLLIRANNLLAVVAGVVVVGGGGWLFYKLVRVLSRIQMPKPPSR